MVEVWDLQRYKPARTPTTMSGLAMEWSREALTHEEWHGARYLASGSLGALAGGLGFVEGTAGLIGAGAYKNNL